MKIGINLYNNKIGYQVSEILMLKEYYHQIVQITLMDSTNQLPNNQGKAKYRIYKKHTHHFLQYMINPIIRVKRLYHLLQLNSIIQYGSIHCLKKHKSIKILNMNHNQIRFYKNSK
jgi:hypothetical protein